MSYLQYCDVNNLYGWKISQKLPAFNFELSFLILPFLLEKQKFGKVENFVTNLKDKCQYVFSIKSLKQALNYGLVLKKRHRAISFNQDEWLKPFIEMNNKLRIEAKYDFEKYFFKIMNNVVFGKTMKNVRKHRHIKLVTTERRRTWFQNQIIIQQNFSRKSCS